jgi:hypothetical protein
MHPIIRNTLAVVLGIIVGSIVNMQIINFGMSSVPLPEGVDPMNAIDWDLMHFATPFLAHALGTLAGAAVASFIAASYKKIFALIIGAVFLAGGITMVFIIPAPVWFITLDLVVAYLPMGWLGWFLATGISSFFSSRQN